MCLIISAHNVSVLFHVLHTAGLVDSSQLMLSLGACTALAEAGRRGTLPLPAQGEGQKGQVTKLSIVKALIAKVQSSKEHGKVRSKVAAVYKVECQAQEDQCMQRPDTVY